MTPQVEEKLKAAHSRGLQGILSFENAGGGFGWYSGQGADIPLTAYATMFLGDLAKVCEFERAILERQIAWLEWSQDAAGSWGGGAGTTAYVVWALRTAGQQDRVSVTRALEYLKRNEPTDPYDAALTALAAPTPANLDRLSGMSRDGVWMARRPTWTRAQGPAATLEATALATLALARHNPALADLGAAFLARSKDARGIWGSTQATVLALKALAATGSGSREKVTARLWVNGHEVPGAFSPADQPQAYDISSRLRPGTNEVVFETSSRVNVQVAGRYYVPWGTEDLMRGVEGLNLQVQYDRLEARVGETVTCTVKVECDSFMVIADVSVPPGFTVDRSDLDDLVRRRVVDKVTQTGRTLTFYLPGKGVTFGYKLSPRYPARVSVPRSIAYEYYTPERRVISPPQEISVNR